MGYCNWCRLRPSVRYHFLVHVVGALNFKCFFMCPYHVVAIASTVFNVLLKFVLHVDNSQFLDKVKNV